MNRTRSSLRRVLAAAAVAFAAAVLPASSPAQDDAASAPQTIYYRANTHYHDGDYDEAVREYARLVDSGIESGNLFFNLGNAYFKLGDAGRAIANYERAARLIPADPDLVANLRYARSLTGAEPCEPPLWQRAVFPLRGRMSSSSLAWLTFGLWTLMFASLIVHRLLPRPARFLLYVAGGFAALTFVSGSSLAEQLAADEWPQHAVVVGADDVAARFEPAEDGTVHFSLPEGAKVEVTDRREGWLQISRCDGRRGWIPSSVLEIL